MAGGQVGAKGDRRLVMIALVVVIHLKAGDTLPDQRAEKDAQQHE
jgi:hypothetical protein